MVMIADQTSDADQNQSPDFRSRGRSSDQSHNSESTGYRMDLLRGLRSFGALPRRRRKSCHSRHNRPWASDGGERDRSRCEWACGRSLCADPGPRGTSPRLTGDAPPMSRRTGTGTCTHRAKSAPAQMACGDGDKPRAGLELRHAHHAEACPARRGRR
jgi:hypothetical protein